MKSHLIVALLIACVALIAGSSNVALGVDLDGITCPVSGQPANAEHTVAHAGGTVYVCCPNCKDALEGDPDKYAAKLNFQLAATGQVEQFACPLKGGPMKISVDVDGVEVKVCCGGCKKAAGSDPIAVLFSNTAFAKGFKIKEN